MGPKAACPICFYMDLNSQDDITARFEEKVKEQGLQQFKPEGMPTHVGKRQLDFLWTDVPTGRGTAVVRNGEHCRLEGCTMSICGRRREVLGSADLDHDPVTYGTPGGPPAREVETTRPAEGRPFATVSVPEAER